MINIVKIVGYKSKLFKYQVTTKHPRTEDFRGVSEQANILQTSSSKPRS